MTAARLPRALALLLLAWAALVAQAHGHLRTQPAAPSIHAAAAQPDPALDCPVCRLVAGGAHYLSPGPASFAPPAVAALVPAPAAPAPASAPSVSHAWRSRAPPASLPA